MKSAENIIKEAPPSSALPLPTPDLTEPVTSAPSPTPFSTLPADPSEKVNGIFEAVFLGIKGYGKLKAQDVKKDGARLYRFRIGGEERSFSVRSDPDFSVQNMLMEQYSFAITIENDEVISVLPLDPPGLTECVVNGTPGLRTLKNFLATACMPLGSTLYVYGGGWDWQDEGSSRQAASIGLSGAWRRFFLEQDANYLYKNSADYASSYYPFGGWNEYYYAGLDCSGYLGWVLYNTLETQDGQSGYVFKSSTLAKTLAYRFSLGSHTSAMYELGAGELRPGDIVSMSGHVWICLGKCSDGSIVILHSSPTKSVTGAKGGGVQLSAIDPAERGTGCEAYKLASRYQQKYFPEWAARYPVVVKDASQYLGFTRDGTNGIFRWDLTGKGLTDPDGYADMSAEAILADIFGE